MQFSEFIKTAIDIYKVELVKMGNDNKKGRKAKAKNYNSVFADRLRELIIKTGKKQQEIADNIGVSRQALNKWVNGETVPDIFSVVKIADLFDVSTDYLTGRTDISSMNEDIRAACDVTGLSEKTIQMLSNRDILSYSSINCKNENKGAFYEKVLNEILSSSEFYALVYNFAMLKDISSILYFNRWFKIENIAKFDLSEEEMRNITSTFINHSKSEKLIDYDRDCEICRYINLKIIEELSNTFDFRKRLSTFTKEQFLNYCDESAKKETADNADNNPEEE